MGKASRKKAKIVKTTLAISEEKTHSAETLPGKSGMLQRYYVHLILIAVLGFLAYSNTFNVPFQWDEHNFIVENPIIKNLDYFLEPSKAEGFELYSAVRNRYIGYLTFALNYRLHGFDVTGYHIVNLTIHLLNAMLVYLLVILTFRTPFLRVSALREKSGYIALFTALLFVSHPIQTEAVTYIFQRLASLAAFFCLLSIAVYIKSRLSEKNSVKYSFYALSVISAILAMKTKENAFILPIAIVLYEYFFFNGKINKRLLWLIPLLLTMLIVPLTIIGLDRSAGEIISGLDSATVGYKDVSRGDYLLTQFRVIVTYIRLLFFPINQTIDYDYPIYTSFFDPPVILSFLFLLSLMGGAGYLLYRSRFSDRAVRLAVFGISWFFLALAMESSIVSIATVIDEYRVYLPSVGAFAAMAVAAIFFLKKLHSRFSIVFALALISIPVIFAGATYARNRVWQSEVNLWADVVKKNPQYPRAQYNLAKSYLDEGMLDKAMAHFWIVLKLRPDDADTHTNIGVIYSRKGLLDEAIKHHLIASRLNPNLAEPHINLGLIYLDRGLTNEARRELETALSIDSENPQAMRFLNYIYGLK